MGMNLFVPITKIDVARREVWGRAAHEVPDKVDEMFDYEKSKPYFMEWSKTISDATDGKSLGNLRAMHGKVAAGKLIALNANDADKAFDIGTKVVDDNEWKKCEEGVYTGFSMGGDYVGEKVSEQIGDRTIKRYVARPSEISLVDNPCIPTARFFDVIKADGSIEKRAFVQEIKVEGSPEQADAFAKLLADNGVSIGAAMELVQKSVAAEALAKAERYMLATVEEIEKLEAAKREFSSDERKAAAKEGAALPDGSFPIKSVGDLENAVRAFGRAKDKAAAKAHIIKRAKALGATDKLPDAWTKDGEKTVTTEIALKKGMWSVQNFAECIECLAGVCRSAQYDLEAEGDDSPVPMKLRNVLADAIAVFKDMSAEEADECLAELKAGAGVGADDEIEEALEAAARAGTLRKSFAAMPFADLFKLASEQLTVEERAAAVKPGETVDKAVKALQDALVAKAMPKAHADMMQAIHDHAASMGAECNAESAKSAQTEGLAKVADLSARVTELTAIVEQFKKMPVPHIMLRTVAKEVARSDPQTERKTNDAPADPVAKAVNELIS